MIKTSKHAASTLTAALAALIISGMTAQAQTNIAPLGTAGNDGYWAVWGNPTDYINDGTWAWDSSNGFHSDGSNDTTRLWVTWTELYTIDKVELWHCEAGAQYIASDYQIQSLNAGGNPTVDGDWTTVVTVSGNTDVNPSYTFASVTTAGIRLLVTDDGPNAPLRFEEILIYGTLGPDETPPSITTLNAADDATDVLPGGNLVVTFDDNIAIGTGNITIKDLDTPSQTAIPVGDAQISVSGAVLTINPTSDLAASTNYAIQIDATAIDDDAGNSFAGIADDTTWNFTTGVPDLTAPTIVTVNPADDSIDVPLASDLVVTFDENISIGSGNITIKDLDTPSQTVITLPDAQVSLSGAVLTINPDSKLATTTNYAVQIDAGAVTDLSGNPFTGIADDTTWNFATADEPLRIMCLGDSITVGYTDNPGWNNHPFMFGYRSGLYTRLTNAGYNFQFVGGSTEPWTGISGDPTHGGTYTPAFDLRDFGQDGHRGYGGAGIWGNVNSWIDADNPDVILLLIGINGMGGGSQTALTNLVSSIVTHAPDVHLIVAQITPYSGFNQTLYNYNVYVRDTLVPGHVTAGNKVSTVDLYSFFLTDPSTYTTLPSTTGAVAPGVLANGINHPDNPHYDLMAQEWFEGIEALGFGPVNFSSWISDPAFGLAVADQDFGDDSDGDQLSNGLEAWFGTHPGQFNTGLANVSTAGNTTTFTHPQNTTVPDDVSAAYRWSTDLVTFYADAEDNGAGTTVSFAQGAPSGGMVTVTATIAGPVPAKLFVDVEVTMP